MRKFTYIIVMAVAAIALAAFTPSDKGDKPIRYACDDELNDIIVDYYDYFSTISLQDLREYNKDIQRAISRTWDREKVAEIWQEKLREDAERFEGNKKVFILKVASSFDDPNWEVPTKKEILQNLTFDEGRQVFTTFVRQPDGSGKPPKTIAGPGGQTNCGCNQMDDWCFWWEDCNTASCQLTGGCGTLLLDVCDGMCEG
jgi:hypothetical protein